MTNDQTENDTSVSFEDVMLTTEQAAQYLFISAETLSYWRSVDYGPPRHIFDNGDVRYRRGDILEYIAYCGMRVGTPASLAKHDLWLTRRRSK